METNRILATTSSDDQVTRFSSGYRTNGSKEPGIASESVVLSLTNANFSPEAGLPASGMAGSGLHCSPALPNESIYEGPGENDEDERFGPLSSNGAAIDNSDCLLAIQARSSDQRSVASNTARPSVERRLRAVKADAGASGVRDLRGLSEVDLAGRGRSRDRLVRAATGAPGLGPVTGGGTLQRGHRNQQFDDEAGSGADSEIDCHVYAHVYRPEQIRQLAVGPTASTSSMATQQMPGGTTAVSTNREEAGAKGDGDGDGEEGRGDAQPQNGQHHQSQVGWQPVPAGKSSSQCETGSNGENCTPCL
ncbi:unnamed protein product [Protopolystoma xenopodis]|uniref:Uncharacterized protein n=1 Tax=Protopolystoma xenopodis TaxID=117903 RepID=A0A448XNW0_9PLAT|nr:unnamed protein product [Protopolystoma xenopodis]